MCLQIVVLVCILSGLNERKENHGRLAEYSRKTDGKDETIIRDNGIPLMAVYDWVPYPWPKRWWGPGAQPLVLWWNGASHDGPTCQEKQLKVWEKWGTRFWAKKRTGTGICRQNKRQQKHLPSKLQGRAILAGKSISIIWNPKSRLPAGHEVD